MQLNRITACTHRFTPAVAMVAVALALVFMPPIAGAQTKSEESQPSEAKPATPTAADTVQTIFLTNAASQSDLNDIQTDLRNILPRARIYGVTSQNAITLKGTAEDLATAQKLIADLDRPKKIYRLTYTMTDLDGGKRKGSQQFTFLVGLGDRTTFKQGSRVPIVTGTTDGQPHGTQVQYDDVGLSIEARVGGSPDAIHLQTKIEQSSLAEEKPLAPAQDPVVRQTVLDDSSVLSSGKPMILGSLDLPGTTRSQEIAVVAEPVR